MIITTENGNTYRVAEAGQTASGLELFNVINTQDGKTLYVELDRDELSNKMDIIKQYA